VTETNISYLKGKVCGRDFFVEEICTLVAVRVIVMLNPIAKNALLACYGLTESREQNIYLA
jgi:hypothetical protein